MAQANPSLVAELGKKFKGRQIKFVRSNFFLIRKKTFIFSFHFLCLKQAHIIVEFKKISLSFVIISYQIMSLVNVDAFFFSFLSQTFLSPKKNQFFYFLPYSF